MVIMKRFIILLLIILSFSCVTYNPSYMESKTTEERIQDVLILTTIGGIIGASIAIEVMEN